jgi:nucleoside-diphosphate-sugar epimerase
MNKWVIFGASGFIGQNLCEYLIKCGQKIIPFDKVKTDNELLKNCDWKIGNFFDKKELIETIRNAIKFIFVI